MGGMWVEGGVGWNVTGNQESENPIDSEKVP